MDRSNWLFSGGCNKCRSCSRNFYVCTLIIYIALYSDWRRCICRILCGSCMLRVPLMLLRPLLLCLLYKICFHLQVLLVVLSCQRLFLSLQLFYILLLVPYGFCLVVLCCTRLAVIAVGFLLVCYFESSCLGFPCIFPWTSFYFPICLHSETSVLYKGSFSCCMDFWT